MGLTIRETAFDDEARADLRVCFERALPPEQSIEERLALYDRLAGEGKLLPLAAETEDGERAGTFVCTVNQDADAGGLVLWCSAALTRGISETRLYRRAHVGLAKEVKKYGCKGLKAWARRRGVARMLQMEGFSCVGEEDGNLVMYKEFEERDLEDRE